MGDIEKTIQHALSDVEKLESQIDALLNSLKNNETIIEADLVPLTISSSKVSSKRSTKKGCTVSTDLSMKTDGINQKDIVTCRGGFIALDSEMFLIHLLDKWVFGTVLVNKSNRPLYYPELVLTLTSKTQRSEYLTFSYNVRMQLLAVDLKNMLPIGRIPFGIPYQDSMTVCQDDLQLENVQMVQSGGKILLTACFDQPQQFCDDDSNEFTLLVSMCSEGVHVCSRSISGCCTDITSLYNEETLSKHKIKLLMGLSTFRDSFTVGCTKSSVNLNLKSFYSQLGFDKITTETIEKDIVIETLAPKFHTFFGGSMLKIERNSNISNNVRCFIFTRSLQQIQIFHDRLYKWLREQRSVVPTFKIKSSVAKNSNELSNVLRHETTNLLKLIHYNHKGLSSEASSKKDREWMKEYCKCLIASDRIVPNVYM